MIRLKPMEEKHISVLAKIEKQCFSAPWTEAGLRAELESSTAVFLVAEEDEMVCGYGGMHFVCGEGYVDNIAVHPDFRRKGIGEMITKGLLQYGKEHEGSFISLEVRPSNLAAVNLYQKLGFQKNGIRKQFYTNPPEDGWILTKFLKKD